MNESKRGIGRKALYTSMVGAMMLSIMPATFASPAAAAQTCRNMNKIDVCGRFLEVWNKQGNEQNSTFVNGLPITAQRNEINLTDGKTYSTQWFERARYEAHPENKAPYDVLLGLLGVNLTEGRGVVDPVTKQARNASDVAFPGVEKPADTSATKVWFPETRHTVSGKILETWNKYGGLQQFGFPLTEQFNEISTDGKTYAVQYFERNRFELHPEIADPNYQVLLGLLGVQQYKAQAIAAADLPIAPPTNVTSKKDTMIAATGQEPGSLMGIEEGTVTARRHLGYITFNDEIITADARENYFPLAAWYVPTVENGGAYFLGSGDDRHLVVKYKLRPGIKWADGVELTAKDAVFSYKLILNDTNADSSAYLKLSGVDNPSKYTVIYNFLSLKEATAKYNDPKTDKTAYAFAEIFIKLKKPVVHSTYFLYGTVHPEHVLGKVDPTKIQETPFARAPLGYGPFKVEKWTSGVEMVLVQNDNYNLTAKPLLKRIVIKEGVAADSAYQQLKTGDIDLYHGEAALVPPPNADDLRASGVIIESVPAASWEHLDFYFGYEPFKDKRVREAMIRGINRQRVVDVVYRGETQVLHTVVPPEVKTSLGNPDYAKNYPELAAKYKLATYPFDRAAANKLLDDAGWVRGADGIRAKGGQKLSFEYATTNAAVRIAIQVLVQDDLKQIGIDAVLKQYPAGPYFDPEGPINKGVCKLCQFAYVQTSTTGFDTWDENQIPTAEKPNQANRQAYVNPKVTLASQTFNSDLDPKVQAEQSAIAQQELSNDIAVITMIQRLNIEFYRNNLVNLKTTNTSYPHSWNSLQYYFK